jgi:hypothetical protein
MSLTPELVHQLRKLKTADELHEVKKLVYEISSELNKAAAKKLYIGQYIMWDSVMHCSRMYGCVKSVNRRSVTVVRDDGIKWRVPLSMVQPDNRENI